VNNAIQLGVLVKACQLHAIHSFSPSELQSLNQAAKARPVGFFPNNIA
jgi:hypothetical protein